MVAVFVGEDDHFAVFLLQFAQVGVQRLNAVLSFVDLFVKEGYLVVAGADELFALTDFLLQQGYFALGHLLVLGGFLQLCVGCGDVFLQ